MSHIGNDLMIKYEEDNFQVLAEKFILEKEIRDLWADFVYNEYMKYASQKEPPDHWGEDR